MKAKRVVLLSIIGVMALLSTGCEWMRWLRLLSLKKQFAEIERFARIEDQKGLKIRLLKPVVFADDVKLLIEGESHDQQEPDHLVLELSKAIGHRPVRPG